MSERTTLSDYGEGPPAEDREDHSGVEITYASGPGRCDRCGEECSRRWRDGGNSSVGVQTLVMQS
ncbi:MAG: hypothetical protein U5K37_13260 [Natrialbaceae archaeon]|nr:hypothetical protein [Natrialbaceae archaeon]